MIVQAKCVQRAWDSTQALLYVPNGGPLPGGLYELDLANPAHRKLVDLKAPGREFVFQFDRLAANDAASGLYFCAECGLRRDTLNAMGTHVNSEHKALAKKIREAEPDSEPEAEPEETRAPGTNAAGDLRGISPLKCKGCGQPYLHLHALMIHKQSCPGKPPEGIVEEAPKQAIQEATATVA